MTRLSCIVPAFNEGPRIGTMLDAVLAAEAVAEVIVVDDGSTDETVAVVETRAAVAPHLRLIRQPRNGGKTRAVAEGVRAARGQMLLLLDSDLEGLTPGAVSRLAEPVLAGRAEAALSLRGNAPGPWRALGLDYISGERVLARALLADRLDALDRLPKFGLEVFINRIWIEAGLPISVVSWPEVRSPMKHEKRGGLSGLAADVAMMRDIFATISPLDALAQIRAMRALAV